MRSLVIIPTYNELENIAEMIEAIMNIELPNTEQKLHLLIIDDGSPDGTADVVKKYQTQSFDRLFLEERKGKLGLGTAYIHGFRWALQKEYDLIFEMDADFSHNPNDLIKLYKACAEDGFDLAIGSRYIQGVNVVNWPMIRVLMSYFAGYYVRFITGMKVMDTTAGFKCYKKEVLQAIDLDKIKFVGYAFQIEMKFLAWKFGFKIKEVPIIFTDRTKGQSKMTVGIFKEAFLGVIQMKIASFFQDFQRKK
jgi:dolichol-phosphate mannosyltransferase